MSLNTTCVLHSCCETQEGYSIYVVRHRRGIPYILMKFIKISGNRTYFSTYPVESPAFGLKNFLSLQAFFQDIEKKKSIFLLFFFLIIYFSSFFLDFKFLLLNVLYYRYHQLSISWALVATFLPDAIQKKPMKGFHQIFTKCLQNSGRKWKRCCQNLR